MPTTETKAAEFTRRAATWPTIREVAEQYGVSARFVRLAVEKRKVTAMRLDMLRVDPESWEAYLRDGYRPGKY